MGQTARDKVALRRHSHRTQTVSRPRPNRSRLSLLEICCGPRSRLSAEWARRGRTAVRVVLRPPSARAQPPPRTGGGHRTGGNIRAGRVATWYLNLHNRSDIHALGHFVDEVCPVDVWTSPPCRTRTRAQHLVGHRRRTDRPQGEKGQRRVLGVCRRILRKQALAGRRAHHEQSDMAREPFDSNNRPWGIKRKAHAATVHGCAVGLRERGTRRRLLRKAWWIQTTSGTLVTQLDQLRCNHRHKHGKCLGRIQTEASAIYTPQLVSTIADVLIGKAGGCRARG